MVIRVLNDSIFKFLEVTGGLHPIQCDDLIDRYVNYVQRDKYFSKILRLITKRIDNGLVELCTLPSGVKKEVPLAKYDITVEPITRSKSKNISDSQTVKGILFMNGRNMVNYIWLDHDTCDVTGILRSIINNEIIRGNFICWFIISEGGDDHGIRNIPYWHLFPGISEDDMTTCILSFMNTWYSIMKLEATDKDIEGSSSVYKTETIIPLLYLAIKTVNVLKGIDPDHEHDRTLDVVNASVMAYSQILNGYAKLTDTGVEYSDENIAVSIFKTAKSIGVRIGDGSLVLERFRDFLSITNNPGILEMMAKEYLTLKDLEQLYLVLVQFYLIY